ncbi:MAG: branched-chain amino acid ABC transporter permease, partial [Desulfurivibrionaceae bacterium]|nr:branched-chain amino acid ABC transporter permease [Desulfurivibrionaceae bacterium]
MKQFLPLAGLAVLLVCVQLLTQWTGTTYYLTQLTMSAYYSVVIIGLCLLMGYAGQISLGHAGFFAIGGYMSAMLTTRNLITFQDQDWMVLLDKIGFLAARQDLYGEAILSFQPWAAAIIAVGLAGVIAFIIGIPVLKL